MKFFDLFPTPRYLSLAEAGVSISERGIHFISFRHGKPGELSVETFGEISFPEETIISGAVNDEASLVRALTRLSKEYGFKYVALSIPEEKAYLFVTNVEKVPYNDLSDAVAFTIEDNVPTPLSQSVYSFDALVEKDKVKAAVSVLPTEVIANYEKALHLAGLVPVSIDVEPQAVARALIREGDHRTHLIINLRYKKVGLYLVENGVVQFSSTLSIDTDVPGAAGELKAEIKKFFVFWDNKSKSGDSSGGRIEEVILCGEGASNEKLTESIMGDVETPYVLADVWKNVSPVEKRLPVMGFSDSLSYAGAIGVALPQSKHLYV